MDELEFLTETVVDKRGFFYHGDKMPPKKFVKAITTGTYENTSSMYGKGLYCVRHIADACKNDYGPYIYRLYVRGLDNFLHFDEMPYRSVFGLKGRGDEYDSYGVIGHPSYSGRSNTPYVEFVLSQFSRLANRPVDPDDMRRMKYEIEKGMEGRKGLEFSSDIFYHIHGIVASYGIAGVTYTGRQDGRCILVYDFNNVFPVAWSSHETLENRMVPKSGDKRMDSVWSKRSFEKLDYSGNPKARSYLLKWSGDRNVPGDKILASRQIAVRRIKDAIDNISRKGGRPDERGLSVFMGAIAGYNRRMAPKPSGHFDELLASCIDAAMRGDSDSVYSILSDWNEKIQKSPMEGDIYGLYRSVRDGVGIILDAFRRSKNRLMYDLRNPIESMTAGIGDRWNTDYPSNLRYFINMAISLMQRTFLATKGDEFPDKEAVGLDGYILELCDKCINEFQSAIREAEEQETEEDFPEKLLSYPVRVAFGAFIGAMERLKSERTKGV